MASGEKEWRKIASRRTDRGGARMGEQGCSWRSTTMAKQAEERDGCRAGEGASWRRPPAVNSAAVAEPLAVAVMKPSAAAVGKPPWPQPRSPSPSMPRSPSLSPPVSAAAPEGE
ncbi:hypothetical protein OsJ_34383 [Oryza sativa Japonica Group]|uniref:Uncharacterized protein n=1 Tax=Oryza sativa subsp. japonica TaxID=39947 RepID=B9G879_ORYSJ|nr:hypothetical protein OsJ_34383 [Oryza sativa Japonica Group]